MADLAQPSRGAARAALIEIFHSIQGEGRFVGQPMAFLRLATCPIRCRYCDTPQSYVAGKELRVAVAGAARREPNPVSAARAVELTLEVARASPYRDQRTDLRVSVTGGEPLAQPAFVREFGERLADSLDGRALLHLETAALDVDALRVALPVLAHVSADYKLPGTLAAGDFRAQHLACAALAADSQATLDVKIVLTADVDAAEVSRALAELAPLRERMLLVLQPVTPFGAVGDALPTAQLEAYCAAAARAGFDFRVLPQLHPALGVD